jgi:hypothetical protein
LTHWFLWAWREFDKLVIVGVGVSLTIWLLWAWGRFCKTGYCGRGGEFDKLVFVGVGQSDKLVIEGLEESLTN